MAKPKSCLLAVVAALIVGTWAANFVAPEVSEANEAQMQRGKDRRMPGLQRQLEDGLKARRENQLAFIAKVVKLVEDKKLSRGLVNAMYRWAIEQRPDYPFPYFERGVRALASQRKIEI